MKLALALLIGIGTGLLAGRLVDEEPAPTLQPAAPRTDQAAVAAGERVEPARVVPSPAEPLQGEDPALSRLIEEAGRFDLPAKKGRISGRVTDELGRGLGSVVFTLRARFTAEQSRLWTRAPGDEDLRGQVVVYLRHLARTEATTFKVTSDEAGQFAFEDVPDLEYELFADAADYQVSAAVRGTLRLGGSRNFRAEWRGRIRVTVQGLDGQAGLPVEIVGKNGPDAGDWPHHWSPDRPEIKLPAGRWLLRARAGEGARQVESTEVEIEHAVGRPVPEVVLQMAAERSIIHGKVLVESEIPFVGSVFLFEAAEFDDPGQRRRSRLRPVRVGGNEGLEFAFPDRKPGRYVIALMLGHARAHETPEVAIPFDYVGGVVQRDLTYEGPAEEQRLRVRVFGPDGEAFAGRQLQLRLETERSSGPVALSWPVATGVWEAVIRLPESLPVDAARSSTMTIAASPGNDRSMEGRATFRYGLTREVDIRLVEAEAFKLRLIGLDPDLGSYRVLLGRRRGSGFTIEEELTFDRNGEAPELKLRPGTLDYMLWLDVGSAMTGRSQIDQGSITLESGKVATFRVPELHDLVVRSKPGERIRLESSTNSWLGRGGLCGDDGRCLLRHLPRGRYRVWSAAAGEDAARTVDVPETLELEF